MIFKLRMLSGETDGFVREYEVPESTDLLQLHDLVCGDLGYDPFNFSSFFAADSGWNKLQEYTLEDMQDCDAGIAALPMEGTRLCDVLASGVSRLIFVFDMLSARELFLAGGRGGALSSGGPVGRYASGSDGGGYRGGRRERPFQRYDGGIRRFRGYGRRWIRR